jgi:uncharacterized membrane protein YcjF (UPF0283 family)
MLAVITRAVTVVYDEPKRLCRQEKCKTTHDNYRYAVCHKLTSQSRRVVCVKNDVTVANGEP